MLVRCALPLKRLCNNASSHNSTPTPTTPIWRRVKFGGPHSQFPFPIGDATTTAAAAAVVVVTTTTTTTGDDGDHVRHIIMRGVAA